MNILLVTPPLTQVNTPYPATAYLKGFLTSKGYQVKQVDLGIELVNKLFTGKTLDVIFDEASNNITKKTSHNARQIFAKRQQYVQTVDAVMRFLKTKTPR